LRNQSSSLRRLEDEVRWLWQCTCRRRHGDPARRRRSPSAPSSVCGC